MCDPALRDNPPAPDDGHVRTRPFDFQRHLHNQSQPEIADFLARLRAVCDSYGERFTVAEVGGAEAHREMVRFTAPGRLDSAYGFNFRSEEHTSELQSLMRISYAVFCLKKKNKNKN